MTVFPPFQIGVDDIERSSLGLEDLGLWAILVTGCYHLFNSEASARQAYHLLLQDVAVR